MRLLETLLTVVVVVGGTGVWGWLPDTSGNIYGRNFTMPGASPSEPEAYLCTAVRLDPNVEEWIVQFDPMASANRAHHMLLYGCGDVPQTEGYWDCGHHGVCSNSRILFAWAKNAPSASLPDGVGFRVGGSTKDRYLTLQIHYATALIGIQDHSGLTLQLTTRQQKYKAGILLMVDGGTIIAGETPKVHADMVCQAKSAGVVDDIHVFGYRVHTHVLGRVVSGYKYDQQTKEYEQIAKGNPQWPQAFYPRTPPITITPEDVVAARCTYNSTGRTRTTFIGGTAKDEMCNLYMMYYTDRERGGDSGVCGGVALPEVIANLPEGNDVALPPNPLLEEKAKGENTNKGKKVTYSPLKEIIEKPIIVEKKAHQFETLNPQGYPDYPSSQYDYQDYDYNSGGRGGLLRRPVGSSQAWRPSQRGGPQLGVLSRSPAGPIINPSGGVGAGVRSPPLYSNRGGAAVGGVLPPIYPYQTPSRGDVYLPSLPLPDSYTYASPVGRGFEGLVVAAGEIRGEKTKLHPQPMAAPGDHAGAVTGQQQQQQEGGADVTDNLIGDEAEGHRRTGKKLDALEFKVSSRWASSLNDNKLGQVVAVAVDSSNDVVIFHRASNVWDGSTFDSNNRLTDMSDNFRIKDPTLLHLSATTGTVLHEWGKDLFYLPHGVTIDNLDNLWLTDVGMHQVFKFPPQWGNGRPLLTLGTLFEPGSDNTHFCKPTSVAVMQNGQFFVADGYCNSRIIKYSKEGNIITQYGKNSDTSFMSAFVGTSAPPGALTVPHSLTLVEDREVCVADRENGRVQCFTTGDKPLHTRIFAIPEWGGRLFAVAYSPVEGGRLYCVNGPQMIAGHRIQVYEVDFNSKKLLSTFSPDNQGLDNPHDLTLSADGAELYVAEIRPNRIWKFISDSLLKTRPHVGHLSPAQSNEAALHVNQILHGVGSGLTKLMGEGVPLGSGKWSSAGVSSVVLGLLAVPILVLTSVTLIVRAKRRGKISLRSSRSGSAGGFGNSNLSNGSSWRSDSNGLHQLGSSLLNKHKGFRQLATEDVDEPSSGDSDIEEFSQVATKA